MEASATHETAEIARLRLEQHQLETERDRLVALRFELDECLHEIMQDTIILDRAVLTEVGPALRAVPIGSLRAFFCLLADMNADGVTKRAWTGKALGEELGLARANYERLLAPLVAAGAIEPVGKSEQGGYRYRFALSGRWKQSVPAVAQKPTTAPQRRGFVYLLQNEARPEVYKIGRTKDPASRRATFGVSLPFNVEYVCVIETEDMVALEKELHARFASKRVGGEWFALSPEDVSFIKFLGSET